jgi:cell division protein ZapE
MILNLKQQKILQELEASITGKKILFSRTKQSCFYIYGNTGCGKTTLMDMFFEGVVGTRKINMHFHDYFADISRLLTKYTVDKLVQRIAKKIDIICFDEFNVDNITDGLLLMQLFEEFFKEGVRIVLTSNFAPEKLFLNGFNRERVFPQFSNLIYQKMHVYHLDTQTDYRTEGVKKTNKILFEKRADFEASIHEYQKFAEYSEDKIGVFEHENLFKKPISTHELINIARGYHLVCLANLPVFNWQNEDEAIRFRNLIDVLYLRNINILLHSNQVQNLDELFCENFAKQLVYKRTLSRLWEMSWADYIYDPHKSKKRLWADSARDFFEKI